MSRTSSAPVTAENSDCFPRTVDGPELAKDDSAKARSMYEWFAQSAVVHSDRTALEVAGHHVTYRQLEEYAESTAAQLLSVTPHPRRVGLRVERNIATYATYLAIQRLGATAVPINPLFPPERVTTIVNLVEMDMMVSSATTTPEYGCPSVMLHPDLQDLPRASAPTATAPTSTDWAYVLFTSGSTGIPKGVPVTHANVDAYTRHILGRYRPTADSRLSQTFDLTFDPSVFDMMAAWGSGATLVVPSRSDLLAPVRFVSSKRITHWFSVPSIVSMADRLRGLREGVMPSLEWTLFAGEPLTDKQAKAWKRAAPNAVMENIYGPTELTVTCTEYRLPTQVESWVTTTNGTVPIGTSYPHLEWVVLDSEGRESKEGELCMRGPQRFPGYLDDRDNAQRFMRSGDAGRWLVLEAAKTPVPAQDWYRTGDRVKVSSEGLVHMGRMDNQIKLRGYRVELGEIEAWLRKRKEVRDAVVLPIHRPDGDIDLVAVCTGDEIPQDELLHYLRERLPSYMVPSCAMWRAQMPLNLNGKIDRGALSEALEVSS